MYQRQQIDPRRRTNINVLQPNKPNNNMTNGENFFQRRKLFQQQNPPEFNNKYHKRLNQHKQTNNFNTSDSDNSTDISSENQKISEYLK